MLPITTAEQSLSNGAPSGTVSSIFLEATSQTRLSAAYQEAYAALLTRHNVTADNGRLLHRQPAVPGPGGHYGDRRS